MLDDLSEQSESRRLKEILLEVRDYVEKGDSLSGAMSRFDEFPPLMVSMVKAARSVASTPQCSRSPKRSKQT